MKWLDVKSILTFLFSLAVVALTVVLVLHAVKINDTENVRSLIDRFSTATISGLSLALGYFFGKHKVLEPEITDGNKG